MPRNIAAGKAAVGPLNTLDSEITSLEPPRRSLRQPMPKLNDYENYLKLKTPLHLVITH